jgi:hypothetical protein
MSHVRGHPWLAGGHLQVGVKLVVRFQVSHVRCQLSEDIPGSPEVICRYESFFIAIKSEVLQHECNESHIDKLPWPRRAG